MLVEILSVGALQANCVLVADETSRRTLIIDPGDEASRILATARRLELVPEAIVATHGHFDHVGAVRAVREAARVPFLALREEQEMLEAASARAELFGFVVDPPPPADRWLSPGEELRAGALRFAVVHAPGHSPGHLILVGEGIAVVGDVVFAGSVGRTDLPGGDTETLFHSIKTHVLPLPDATVLYPGHGPITSVGRERATNPFLVMLARG